MAKIRKCKPKGFFILSESDVANRWVPLFSMEGFTPSEVKDKRKNLPKVEVLVFFSCDLDRMILILKSDLKSRCTTIPWKFPWELIQCSLNKPTQTHNQKTAHEGGNDRPWLCLANITIRHTHTWGHRRVCRITNSRRTVKCTLSVCPRKILPVLRKKEGY